MLYASLKEEVRAQWSEKLSVLVEAARSRGRLNASSEGLLRRLTAGVEYQYLIDHLICAEQTIDQEGALLDLERCTKSRQALSEEMFHFMGDYASLDSITDLALTRCMAKTRLISVEMRYPPYDFMKERDHQPPQARDANAFLQCAKSRL